LLREGRLACDCCAPIVSHAEGGFGGGCPPCGPRRVRRAAIEREVFENSVVCKPGADIGPGRNGIRAFRTWTGIGENPRRKLGGVCRGPRPGGERGRLGICLPRATSRLGGRSGQRRIRIRGALDMQYPKALEKHKGYFLRGNGFRLGEDVEWGLFEGERVSTGWVWPIKTLFRCFKIPFPCFDLFLLPPRFSPSGIHLVDHSARRPCSLPPALHCPPRSSASRGIRTPGTPGDATIQRGWRGAGIQTSQVKSNGTRLFTLRSLMV
jgi:hypothetical protein